MIVWLLYVANPVFSQECSTYCKTIVISKESVWRCDTTNSIIVTSLKAKTMLQKGT